MNADHIVRLSLLGESLDLKKSVRPAGFTDFLSPD